MANNALIPAAAIFALTYAILGMQGIPKIHIDRPSGALIGAVGMVALGVSRSTGRCSFSSEVFSW